MNAGVYDIVLDQGSDYVRSFTITDNGVARDLTAYSGRGQIRPRKTSSTLTESFTVDITDPEEGTFEISLTNSQTAAITPGIYYYDIELYTSGDGYVLRLLEGKITVRAETTR